MKKEDLKKEFTEKFLQLRKLLNSWELIPGSPKDEFDSLNHRILSHLYKGTNIEKITRVLSSELTATYGLFTDENDAKKIAHEVMEWWNSTDRRFN